MLSLTNPFRHATQHPNHCAVPLAPPLAPLVATTTTTSAPTRPPWQTDQKLSSLLSACEAGTHAFSHDDYADGTRRPSTGSEHGLSQSTGSTTSDGDLPMVQTTTTTGKGKVVSSGWPLGGKCGHFDPSRDPRLLYL